MPMNSYDLSDRFKQLTYAEIEFIKQIAQTMPDGAVWINIGAGHGTSAMAVSEARRDIKVVTVDVRHDHPTGSIMGEHNSFQEWVEAGELDYPEEILADSAETGSNWSRDKVDVVFIDGDHYDGCRRDWEAWNDKVKAGGVIMFHDYMSVYGPGVFPVVEDVKKEHEIIDFVDTLIAFRMNNGRSASI